MMIQSNKQQSEVFSLWMGTEDREHLSPVYRQSTNYTLTHTATQGAI